MNLPLRFWLFALCLSALVGGVAGWQMGRGFSEEPEVAIAQEPAVNQRTVKPVVLPAEKEEEKMPEPEPEPPPMTEETRPPPDRMHSAIGVQSERPFPPDHPGAPALAGMHSARTTWWNWSRITCGLILSEGGLSLVLSQAK